MTYIQCPGCGIVASLTMNGWIDHRISGHNGRIVASHDGIRVTDGYNIRPRD